MAQYPETATVVGYPGQNARWTDYSQPAIGREPHISRRVSSESRQSIAPVSGLTTRSRTTCIAIARTAAKGLDFHNDAMPLRGVIPHNLRMPMSQIEGVQQDSPNGRCADADRNA